MFSYTGSVQSRKIMMKHKKYTEQSLHFAFFFTLTGVHFSTQGSL